MNWFQILHDALICGWLIFYLVLMRGNKLFETRILANRPIVIDVVLILSSAGKNENMNKNQFNLENWSQFQEVSHAWRRFGNDRSTEKIGSGTLIMNKPNIKYSYHLTIFCELCHLRHGKDDLIVKCEMPPMTVH